VDAQEASQTFEQHASSMAQTHASQVASPHPGSLLGFGTQQPLGPPGVGVGVGSPGAPHRAWTNSALPVPEHGSPKTSLIA
jgi:hypothetical protein